MGCFCSLAAWLVKYILFFVNLLFVLTGIAIVVVGALIQTHFVDYNLILDGLFSESTIALIVIGSFVFLVAFFGCCGAVKENRCLLLTYGVLVLCIFIAEVALGVWALAANNQADALAESNVYKIFDEEYKDKNSTMFDLLQREFECCGVNGPKDFVDIFEGGMVPSSCCPPSFLQDCTNQNSLKDGCYRKLKDYIDESIETVGYVALSVASVEVLAMIFAFCLAGHFKEGKTVY